MSVRAVAFNAFGFRFVKYGALTYVERKGFKFFLKAGTKFSLKVAGLELTNKHKILY